MAEDRIGTPSGESQTYWAWTELFRTFQIALDPKKLILAAAGIVTMWIGWLAISGIFYSMRSVPTDANYQPSYYENRGMSPDEARKRATEDLNTALLRYQLLHDLAGPDGLFRTAPWFENRGPNPFQLATGRLGRPWSAGHSLDWLLTDQVPVLIEPLVKLLRPIVLLVSPRADGWNRAYLLFITFWTLLTWGIFGGAITRLAAVQLTGKDRPGLFEAVRFVTARYVSYILSPAVPLICVALIAILSVLYGLIHLIPVVGDIADSVAWPFLMLLGFGQAILLIGMVGYPLMYATISAEGSDTFDALSRSYNYVLQSPWNYIWYSIVAVVYGAVLVFFVGFVGSMVVYLTKWSVGLTPGTEYFASRRVENLFIYAPTSFGWRDLLIGVEPGTDPDARVASLASSFYWWNYLSAALVSFWVTLIFLLVIGFAYSYYFTAFTQIYFLMRRKVDDVDLDEVYLEEDEPDEPHLPPTPTQTGPPGGTTLPMVDAPRPATGDGAPPAP
jgi:hypothetical protein